MENRRECTLQRLGRDREDIVRVLWQILLWKPIGVLKEDPKLREDFEKFKQSQVDKDNLLDSLLRALLPGTTMLTADERVEKAKRILLESQKALPDNTDGET